MSYSNKKINFIDDENIKKHISNVRESLQIMAPLGSSFTDIDHYIIKNVINKKENVHKNLFDFIENHENIDLKKYNKDTNFLTLPHYYLDLLILCCKYVKNRFILDIKYLKIIVDCRNYNAFHRKIKKRLQQIGIENYKPDDRDMYSIDFFSQKNDMMTEINQLKLKLFKSNAFVESLVDEKYRLEELIKTSENYKDFEQKNRIIEDLQIQLDQKASNMQSARVEYEYYEDEEKLKEKDIQITNLKNEISEMKSKLVKKTLFKYQSEYNIMQNLYNILTESINPLFSIKDVKTILEHIEYENINIYIKFFMMHCIYTGNRRGYYTYHSSHEYEDLLENLGNYYTLEKFIFDPIFCKTYFPQIRDIEDPKSIDYMNKVLNFISLQHKGAIKIIDDKYNLYTASFEIPENYVYKSKKVNSHYELMLKLEEANFFDNLYEFSIFLFNKTKFDNIVMQNKLDYLIKGKAYSQNNFLQIFDENFIILRKIIEKKYDKKLEQDDLNVLSRIQLNAEEQYDIIKRRIDYLNKKRDEVEQDMADFKNDLLKQVAEQKDKIKKEFLDRVTEYNVIKDPEEEKTTEMEKWMQDFFEYDTYKWRVIFVTEAKSKKLRLIGSKSSELKTEVNEAHLITKEEANKIMSNRMFEILISFIKISLHNALKDIKGFSDKAFENFIDGIYFETLSHLYQNEDKKEQDKIMQKVAIRYGFLITEDMINSVAKFQKSKFEALLRGLEYDTTYTKLLEKSKKEKIEEKTINIPEMQYAMTLLKEDLEKVKQENEKLKETNTTLIKFSEEKQQLEKLQMNLDTVIKENNRLRENNEKLKNENDNMYKLIEIGEEGYSRTSLEQFGLQKIETKLRKEYEEKINLNVHQKSAMENIISKLHEISDDYEILKLRYRHLWDSVKHLPTLHVDTFYRKTKIANPFDPKIRWETANFNAVMYLEKEDLRCDYINKDYIQVKKHVYEEDETVEIFSEEEKTYFEKEKIKNSDMITKFRFLIEREQENTRLLDKKYEDFNFKIANVLVFCNMITSQKNIRVINDDLEITFMHEGKKIDIRTVISIIQDEEEPLMDIPRKVHLKTEKLHQMVDIEIEKSKIEQEKAKKGFYFNDEFVADDDESEFAVFARLNREKEEYVPEKDTSILDEDELRKYNKYKSIIEKSKEVIKNLKKATQTQQTLSLIKDEEASIVMAQLKIDVLFRPYEDEKDISSEDDWN